LKAGLGESYRDYFEQFDEKPFAAASIGQVHYAVLKETSRPVAVKIQYPGVENSIKSDIDNLMTLLSVTNLLPPGLYVENVIKHVKIELFNECDYIREANYSEIFADLLKNDAFFTVPKVYKNVTSKHVLVTDFVNGVSIDKCMDLDEDTRNTVCSASKFNNHFVPGLEKISFALRLPKTCYGYASPNYSNGITCKPIRIGQTSCTTPMLKK
jgi:aarF domain-containing kinase